MATGVDDVQSMDIFVENSAIHVLVAGVSDQGQSRVRYVHSRDGGLTWSSAIDVDGATSGTVSVQRGNDVQIAAAGQHIVAAWRVAGELPFTGQITTAFSRDGGQTWIAGAKPSGEIGEFDQSYMDLAADNAGRFHIIWLDDREESGRHQGLRYARSDDGGYRWTAQETIDPVTCTCCWTTLKAAPDGVLQILYRDIEPHDMAIARSTDSGKRWRRIAEVGKFGWSFQGCPHVGGGLAIAGETAGLVLDSVVWTGNERSPGLYHLRSIDSGQSWTRPHRLVKALAAHHDIAVFDEDQVAVVWETEAGQGSVISLSLSTDGGRAWSQPKPISLSAATARYPRIVATPSGFRAFWTEKSGGAASNWALASMEIPVLDHASTLVDSRP